MADVFNSMKKTWLKGVEAVSNAASNIASNTKQKLSEMNLEERRREILADFGLIAYEMWQKGSIFPKELNDQLEALSRLDEELNALRAQRVKDVPQDEASTEDDAAEAAPAQLPDGEEAAPSDDAPVSDDTNQQ